MRKGNFIQHLINAAIFILLEVAALNMLRHNGEIQNIWISEGMHGISAYFWGGAQNIRQYFSLRKTNDELALENFELRTQLAELTEHYRDSIASASADRVVGVFRYTPATIAKISNNSQHNYMIIDKGSKDGIVNGAGVMTSRGAVGVVDAVGENFSYARSFKNHEMSISARLGLSGAVGPLSWDGKSSDGAILKEIPHHMAFSQGDTVYTSGFSSIFPSDIPLGTVGEAKVVNGATYEIKVRLFENFSSLRYVTIVENLGKKEIKKLEEAGR